MFRIRGRVRGIGGLRLSNATSPKSYPKDGGRNTNTEPRGARLFCLPKVKGQLDLNREIILDDVREAQN